MRSILSFVLFMLGVSVFAIAAPPGFITIDVPGATNGTIAWGINAHGDIVGHYLDSIGQHGFLLSGGIYTTIDIAGASGTGAHGINSHGDIVGSYHKAGVNHGYLLSGGVFTTIDFPGAEGTGCGGGAGTGAVGINLLGDIVGVYAEGGTRHGFLLSRGSFTTIDPPGAICTQAMGISTAGDIVGWFIDAGGVYHGFLLSGGIFTTIDVPVPGNPDAGAFGIDPSGTFVVGFYSPTAADINGLLEHGFLLTGGIFTTTIDYPLAGVGVTEAVGVNSQGDIVGDYVVGNYSNSIPHGFLLGKQKKK